MQHLFDLLSSNKYRYTWSLDTNSNEIPDPKLSKIKQAIQLSSYKLEIRKFKIDVYYCTNDFDDFETEQDKFVHPHFQPSTGTLNRFNTTLVLKSECQESYRELLEQINQGLSVCNQELEVKRVNDLLYLETNVERLFDADRILIHKLDPNWFERNTEQLLGTFMIPSDPNDELYEWLMTGNWLLEHQSIIEN